MRYVITGGLGFIGSHFIRKILLEQPSISVLNVDCVTYAANLYLNDEFKKNKNYSFAYADIANPYAIHNLIEDGDIVINFAAESHVDRSIEDGTSFLKTNILGTHNLLKACQNRNISKFLQISTDEVYGSLNFTDAPKHEDDHINPSSLYSASKASAEMVCFAMFHTFKMPILITRSSNNYGTHQYPEKLIPFFVKRLSQGQNVTLYGDGQNIRDWLHVQDNCDAIQTVIEKGTFGQVYNIGGCNQISNIDITRKILKIMNLDDSRIAFVKDRLGHDVRYDLNCKKTISLGWQPKRNVDDELPKIIEWYLEDMKGNK